jgi:hypothetical protein
MCTNPNAETIRNMKKESKMTSPKLINFTVTNNTNSKVDEISDKEFKKKL